MTWNRRLQLRDDVKQREQAARTAGYRDGYALAPAASLDRTYQQAWKRGREARRQDGAA